MFVGFEHLKVKKVGKLKPKNLAVILSSFLKLPACQTMSFKAGLACGLRSYCTKTRCTGAFSPACVELKVTFSSGENQG